MRQVQVQKHFWPSVRYTSYAFALSPKLTLQAQLLQDKSMPNQYLAFQWQGKEAEGCSVCLHHLGIHHEVKLLP